MHAEVITDPAQITNYNPLELIGNRLAILPKGNVNLRYIMTIERCWIELEFFEVGQTFLLYVLYSQVLRLENVFYCLKSHNTSENEVKFATLHFSAIFSGFTRPSQAPRLLSETLRLQSMLPQDGALVGWTKPQYR